MKIKQTIIKNNQHFKTSIENTIINNRKEIYSYLNTYTLYLINKNSQFKKYIKNANYIRIGGIGTKIYYKLLLDINIEKVTFSHFFLRFGGSEFISKKKFSVYCIGGSPKVSNKLKEVFIQRKINLVGTHHGYFTKQEVTHIITEINLLKPQIILVGLGTPLSDSWTFANKDKLPNCAIIHVGNTFDILTDQKKIGPGFLFNSGFEWLFRLLQEPKRLSKRYAKSNFNLFILLLKLFFTNEKK